jgi:hypothetical protein
MPMNPSSTFILAWFCEPIPVHVMVYDTHTVTPALSSPALTFTQDGRVIRVLRLVVFNFGFTSESMMNATAEPPSDDFVRLRLHPRLISAGRPGKVPISSYRPSHACRLKPTHSPLQALIRTIPLYSMNWNYEINNLILRSASRDPFLVLVLNSGTSSCFS